MWLCALIVTLSLGETRAENFFATPSLELEQNQPQTQASTREITFAYGYDASDYALAPKTTVIGKWDPVTKNISGVKAGENTLLKHLPNQGSYKTNWKQNSSVLRQEIRKGRPIRDAAVKPNEQLDNNTGFLRAERELLKNQGWKYNPSTQTWNP